MRWDQGGIPISQSFPRAIVKGHSDGMIQEIDLTNSCYNLGNYTSLWEHFCVVVVGRADLIIFTA